MRDYQTLCVPRQCIGLIGWYLWDENERASAARLQATQAKIAAPDASVKHELLNQRYHMAQLMWSDQPGKVRVYRSCLESKEEWGGVFRHVFHWIKQFSASSTEGIDGKPKPGNPLETPATRERSLNSLLHASLILRREANELDTHADAGIAGADDCRRDDLVRIDPEDDGQRCAQ